MNPINNMYDLIERNSRLEGVILRQKQHIAELVKWEAVFGHLGTPDEVGNEWHKLLDRISKLERALHLAVQQNSHDMLMTGDELRQCEAALEKSK